MKKIIATVGFLAILLTLGPTENFIFQANASPDFICKKLGLVQYIHDWEIEVQEDKNGSESLVWVPVYACGPHGSVNSPKPTGGIK